MKIYMYYSLKNIGIYNIYLTLFIYVSDNTENNIPDNKENSLVIPMLVISYYNIY